jgi:hypothetical protein
MGTAKATVRRLFPRTSTAMYEAGGTDVGKAFLELAYQAPGLLRRFWPFGPPKNSGVPLLLNYHRLALTAEVAGAWDRADFYWLELHAQLRERWPDEAAWNDAGTLAGGGQPPPSELKTAFASQVLLETHLDCSIAHQAAQGEAFSPRASLHLVHGATVSGICGLAQEPRLMSAMAARVRMLMESGHSKPAREMAAALHQLAPSDVITQELYIAAIHEEVMKQVKGATDAAAIVSLKKAAGRLEPLRKSTPAHPFAFQAQASIYGSLVLRYATDRQLTEALIAIEKADVLHPGRPDVAELRQGLQSLIQNIWVQIKSVTGTGANLNEIGARLLREVQNGPGKAEQWRQSKEAAEIAAQRDAAYAGFSERAHPMAIVDLPAAAFTVASTVKRSGKEPFGEWLGSKVATGFRARMAVAVVLLIAGQTVAQYREHLFVKSKQAWTQLQQAAAGGDDLKTIDAAESYFTTAGGVRNSDRDQTARRWYSLALVRWFSQLAAPSAADLERAKRYSQALASVSEGKRSNEGSN